MDISKNPDLRASTTLIAWLFASLRYFPKKLFPVYQEHTLCPKFLVFG